MVSVVGWDMRENRLVLILLKKGARRRIIKSARRGAPDYDNISGLFGYFDLLVFRADG